MVDPPEDCLRIEDEQASKTLVLTVLSVWFQTDSLIPGGSVGSEHSSIHTLLPPLSEICENGVDAEDHNTPITNFAKTSVKELMEVEMRNEEGSKIRSNCSEMDLEKIESKYQNIMEKNHKRKQKSCHVPRDMDVPQLGAANCFMPENFHKVLEQRPSDDLVPEIVMQALAQIKLGSAECMKHDFLDCPDVPSGQTISIAEEQLVAAVNLFIEQRLSNSKHFEEEGKSCCSRELVDALRTLSSNKGLLLKLLQDRDTLLVKPIQNLEDAQLRKDRTCSSSSACNSSEEKPKEFKSNKFSSHGNRNFFHRRRKLLDSYLLKRNKDFQSSSKIAVLKPGPAPAQSPETDVDFPSNVLQSRCEMDKNVHNQRNALHFSLTDIKKKLRQAIGKHRGEISTDGRILKFSSNQNGNSGDKGTSGEIFCWRSPNRNHFFTERFAKSSTSFKRGEQVGKLKYSGSTMLNQTCQSAKLGVSDIYIEAKKHLSEMLTDGDENAESTNRESPKSLGRILSLSDYSGSPCCSPREQNDDVFTTSVVRLSPCGLVKNNVNGLLQENHSNHPSRQTLDYQPCISASNPDVEVQCLNMNLSISLEGDKGYSSEIQSFNEDIIIPKVSSSFVRVVENQETTGSSPHGEENTTNICTNSSSNFVTGDSQNADIRGVEKDEIASECLKDSSACFKPDLFGEVQVMSSPQVSPTCSPVSRELKESNFVIDRTERPSPASVLEPLSTDDDISPATTVSQPVKKEIQPRNIDFEQQSSDNDQVICMRISTEGEESAFEYVEAVLLGSGLNWDEFHSRWLSLYEILDQSLFDEVKLYSGRPCHDQKLLFDCANEVLDDICESYFGSFTKQNIHIQPILKGIDLIHEVWERIECHLIQHATPHPLDQLVRRDIARSRKWMNLQSDTELVSFEMSDTIFNEIVDDTLMCFIDCTSKYKFQLLQAESDSSRLDSTRLRLAAHSV
ncbi:UNVERIFIED_CONTAM: protein TRM32 [Sesamum radiatum]|uniref:Protein TRM32 n=1 Tax=Sesamum radiatum TaxID=300843 RepID=A0AAW2R0X3_SESRA